MNDSLLSKSGKNGGEALRIRCDTNVNLLIKAENMLKLKNQTD